MLGIRSVSSIALGMQVHINDVKPDEERFIAAFNRPGSCINKPSGGLWTSTHNLALGCSDWVDWCRGNDFGDPDATPWWIVIPDWRLTLVEIDSRADLDDLLAVTATGVGDRWEGAQIDFEKLRDEGYAGIHLTERGNAECHYAAFGEPSLNSWDVESTVWFDWCFTDVQMYQVLPPGAAQEGVRDYA